MLRLMPLEDRTAPATFTVDTVSDATAADGKTTLREALFAANTSPGADAITFAPALAGGTIALAGGGLSVATDVTITGPADNPITVAAAFAGGALPPDTLTVQAGATAAVSGLRFRNTTPTGHGVVNLGTLTLTGVTITGVTDGGGLLNLGTATVSTCVISGNTTAAVFEAGGVTNAAGGTLTVRDTRIENNATTDASVGAGGGLAALGGRVDLANVNITGNRAGIAGGGVLVSGGTFTAGSGVVIENNTAPLGGGVVIVGLPPNGTTPRVPTATFTGVVVRGNTAGSGGGIAVAAFDAPYAPTVTLTDVTVANNSADANSTASVVLGVTGTVPPRTLAVPRGIGGGLGVTGGSVTVTGGTFAGNTATAGGGLAVYLGSLGVAGAAVTGNTAVGGGGLAAVGSSAGAAVLALTNTTVADNDAAGNQTGDLTYSLPGVTTPAIPRGAGGGLVAAGAAVTVRGGSFARNTATAGGGVASVGPGTVGLDQATVTANQATGRAGGLLVAAGAVTLTNSTADANTAGGPGGGADVTGGGLTATNLTLAGNSAAAGGGLAVEGGTAALSYATAAGNSAATSGGGLSSSGGGLSMRNAIVAGNTAPASPDVSGTVTARGGNLVGAADGATGFGPSDHTGTAALPIDPHLGPLSENGGPTRTRLPAADSPALNIASGDAATTTDQRGRPRPAAAPDAGAVERQPDDPAGGLRPLVPRTFAVGRLATVTVYNPDGTVRLTLTPFGPDFTGGVRVATTDFNGDGVDDVAVGTGPGTITRVRVIDGRTQAVLADLRPFEERFTGGVFVTAGDVGGDGVPDLIVTPDEGGGPVVVTYPAAGAEGLRFFGIEDPGFRGGARAAVADYSGDGRGDLVVAAGFGGGPRLSVWDGTSQQGPALTRHPFADLFVFEQTLRNGVYAAAGDLDGDGFADLIVGGGPGGGPRVLALSGKALVASNGTQQVALANFFAGDSAARGGVRVTVKNLDGDALGDFVTGNDGGQVTAFPGTVVGSAEPTAVLAFDAADGIAGGVFVG